MWSATTGQCWSRIGNVLKTGGFAALAFRRVLAVLG
jgi:hypothetical protein